MSFDLKTLYNSINNIYKIDLLLIYTTKDKVDEFINVELLLENNFLTREQLEDIIKNNTRDYNIKYILQFNIKQSLNILIENLKEIDYELVAIKKLKDIIFTNNNFLNTLILIFTDDTGLKIIKHNNTKKRKIKL